MATIRIGQVTSGSKDYHAQIVLTETQEIQGEPADVPIGEASISIPWGTEPADVKTIVIDAATRIMKHHKDAQDKRHDLEEIDFPPIP